MFNNLSFWVYIWRNTSALQIWHSWVNEFNFSDNCKFEKGANIIINMFDKIVKQSKREKFSQLCSEQEGSPSRPTQLSKFVQKSISLSWKSCGCFISKKYHMFLWMSPPHMIILSINFYCGKHKQCWRRKRCWWT